MVRLHQCFFWQLHWLQILTANQLLPNVWFSCTVGASCFTADQCILLGRLAAITSIILCASMAYKDCVHPSTFGRRCTHWSNTSSTACAITITFWHSKLHPKLTFRFKAHHSCSFKPVVCCDQVHNPPDMD